MSNSLIKYINSRGIGSGIDTIPDYTEMPAITNNTIPGSTISVQGKTHIFSSGFYSPVRDTGEGIWYMAVDPEMFGAIGDGVHDDTSAFQQAIDSGKQIILRSNRNYKITNTLICCTTYPTLRIQNLGATITASFGTNYSKALFSNNKTTNSSCALYLMDLSVKGNCVVVDLNYSVDNPNSGLSLVLHRLSFNTYDGNKRPGTAAVIASAVDFVDINKVNIWNSDMGIAIGAAPPVRNCTQIRLSNVMLGQVNTGIKMQGVNKACLDSVDIMTCNSGFVFTGNNANITLNLCHVEGIYANSSYSTPSTYVQADSSGIGFYFPDSAHNQNIVLNQCDIIDLGTVGGSAVAGYYVGRCNSAAPSIQRITFNDCTCSPGMGGSAAFKSFVNRGKFKWNGVWSFASTAVNLWANGLGYIDMEISDPVQSPNIMNWNNGNLLKGNTILSLIGGNGGTAPTITENAPSYSNLTYSHKISFNSIYELYQQVNLPYGWCTVDVIGYISSGNPVLYVQNPSTYVDMVRVQFNGLNDKPRRWRIAFWNPTPLQAYKIGFTNQSATAGADSCIVNSISVYQGLPKAEYALSDVELVSALPTPSRYWYGKTMIVRTAGAEDTMFVGISDSAGNPAFKSITLS